MKRTKSEKGITLVALIITIVLLLILAVVTVMSLKEEKILSRAESAANQDTIAREKEIIELAKAEAKVDASNAKYLDKVKAILIKNNNLTVQGNEEKLTVKFKKSERTYIISDTGNVIGGNEKTLVLPEIGTITYEEGMTWEEWINSKYNTYDFYLVYNQYCSGYMATIDMVHLNGKVLCMNYYSDELGYGFSHEISGYFRINEAPYDGFYVTQYYWASGYNNNIS